MKKHSKQIKIAAVLLAIALLVLAIPASAKYFDDGSVVWSTKLNGYLYDDLVDDLKDDLGAGAAPCGTTGTPCTCYIVTTNALSSSLNTFISTTAPATYAAKVHDHDHSAVKSAADPITVTPAATAVGAAALYSVGIKLSNATTVNGGNGRIGVNSSGELALKIGDTFPGPTNYILYSTGPDSWASRPMSDFAMKTDIPAAHTHTYATVAGSGVIAVSPSPRPANTTRSDYTVSITASSTVGQVLKTTEAGVVGWAADTNTTYTAGSGLSLSETEFSVNGVWMPDYGGKTQITTITSINSTYQNLPAVAKPGYYYVYVTRNSSGMRGFWYRVSSIEVGVNFKTDSADTAVGQMIPVSPGDTVAIRIDNNAPTTFSIYFIPLKMVSPAK